MAYVRHGSFIRLQWSTRLKRALLMSRGQFLKMSWRGRMPRIP